MLTILICALALGIPGAIGIMRFAGHVMPLPYFSLDKSQFSEGWTIPSKTLNSLLGLFVGGIFGFVLMFVIGRFMPTHMVPAETINLLPIHQNGNTFYVSIGAQTTMMDCRMPNQASYYSSPKQIDGGTTPTRFCTNGEVRIIYENNRADGTLVRLENAFSTKSSPTCTLFACPSGRDRYEFHIPENGVGMF